MQYHATSYQGNTTLINIGYQSCVNSPFSIQPCKVVQGRGGNAMLKSSTYKKKINRIKAKTKAEAKKLQARLLLLRESKV